MAQYKNCFDIGSSKNRKADSGYTRSRGQYHKLKKSFAPKWQTATPEEKAEMDCRIRKTKNEMLYVPKEKWMRKLLEYHAFKIKLDENGKETWKTIHQGKLINHPDIEIISKFNAEIRGLYHYCQLAHNVSVLGKFAHIMEYSMYKTFACKYRATVSKIID
ncbi:group II intron reverse transcriptase/maturase [Anaerotruncus colihominis]